MYTMDDGILPVLVALPGLVDLWWETKSSAIVINICSVEESVTIIRDK